MVSVFVYLRNMAEILVTLLISIFSDVYQDMPNVGKITYRIFIQRFKELYSMHETKLVICVSG